MTNYRVMTADNSVLLTGDACIVREFLESSFEGKFGFYPMFQESEEEGFLEVYLHTDTYEDLDDEDITKLSELNITECDSLEAICSILELRIEPDKEEETAVCSVCKEKDVDFVLLGHSEDICDNCLPKYISNIRKKPYVAVYSFGGIIDTVEEGDDLREMAREMRSYVEEQGFDGGEDDARIFLVNGGFSKVVYSFRERELLLELDEIEVFNPTEGTISIYSRNTKEDMIVFFDPEKKGKTK